MTNPMRRLALALTLMLCAAMGADAAGLEEAKGLLGQKKYEEAYAAIEQAAAEKEASAPVLATGMEAALGSGRIIMASGLAKRLVKATGNKDPLVLYRCAEIAVLAGEDDVALGRYRAFTELSPDTSASMRSALDYVLPRGTFPDVYKKALAIQGPDGEQMWKQGESILGQLLKVEELDQALEMAELLCQHYGKEALRADTIAAAIHNKRDKYDQKDDVQRILKMLAGTNASDRWVQEFYNQAAKSVPLNERLEFLFSAHRADRLFGDKNIFDRCQDMRLLESDADRLRFGRRYLAWEPAYRAKGDATLYDAYLRTIMQLPQVFKIEGQPLVDSAKATAMFEASAAMRKGTLNWDLCNQFLTGYLRENPAAEEAMLRKHLARLPKEALGRLVELTKGAGLDAMLVQYSGGSYAKTMEAEAYLLSTYDTLKLKNPLFKAAQAQILANPAAFEIGQIQQYVCNSAAATIAEKSAVLLGLLNQLGSTPRFEELAKNLAGDKKWQEDPSFQQFQQGVNAKKTGTDPFLAGYTAAMSEKVENRNQRNQRLEDLVREALAAFPGTIPGDPEKAANETEWMAGNLYEYHRQSVWDNREAVAAMGEIWGPKFRDMGPQWDSLVERGSVEALRKLAPHFTSMLDKGMKASDKSWSAFANRNRPIQPQDDTSVLFEKHYGQMGRYVWDYFFSRRDAWGPEIYYVQLEKALAAGAGKEASDYELIDAANQALAMGQRAKPPVMVPMALMRQLYSDYMALVKKSGKTDQINNMESTLARCQGFTAQDRQAMVDSNLQRIAAMQGRGAQLSELSTFIVQSQVLDEESRKHVLTTTLKAQLDAMQPSDWSTARVHGAVMNHLRALGKDNALADEIAIKLLNGLLMGAQASESRSFVEPMRDKVLSPLVQAGRWEQLLRALDAYSRLVMEDRDWNWIKPEGIDPALNLINAADKPEITYVFATMVLDRAQYAREQVEKDMLAIRGAAAKDIPGLIPVSKDDPLYDLYVAARAVAERDEKRAWELTRPRLNILRQEWPTLDIGFVAWAVEQMRKQRMLSETRDFCFEILLKEYDLPAEDVASVMLTKGDTYRNMNNFQAAAIEYKSLKDNKRYRTTRRGSMAQYRLIDLLIETGEFDAAQGQLMIMTEAGSRDEQAEAYYLLGKIAFEQQDYVQSRDYLTETFKRVDGHAEGRLLEGELKLKLPRGLANTDVLLGRLDLQTVVVPGRELTLKLRDTNLSIAQGGQSIPVIVSTSVGGDRELVRLVVSPDDKTSFQGSIATELATPKQGNMRLDIYGGDQVSYIIDPEYQKANDIDYPAKILEVKSNARLVASSGEFLTPEEEEQRRMELEMRQREGDRESVRFSQQRGTVVRPGSAIYVQVTDFDRDMGEQKDTVTVDARTSSGDLVKGFTLTETEIHSGVFEGELATGIPYPQVTASDVEEGSDPNAIINSTKKGSWVSLPDGVKHKWVDVDTMSSHDVKSMIIKTPDVSRIKSMSIVGVLDVNPINLGNYRIDGQERPLGGVAQLINKQYVGQELVDAREALGKGGEISEVSSMVYRRADTDHKGRDGWVNTSLSGTFWLDEDSTMTFKFMQPASPNGWQSVWLFIDGRVALGGRGVEQGQLAATKAVTLLAGAHTMEVIMVDHWADSSVVVGLGQEDGTFVPMPASLFSVTENKELADALRPRGKVTQTDGGFTVTLTEPERIRSIRCMFDDFVGNGLSVSEISMTASDGKAILPTTHDFSTGLANDTLEIAAGDSIAVSYIDEKRLNDKSPKLTAGLSAQFYNAAVELLYEIIVVNNNGDDRLEHAEAERVNPGAQLVVRVTDYDMDLTDERDTIPVTLTTAGGEKLELTLLEGHPQNPEDKNQAHTGVFSEFLKLGDVTGKNTLKALPKDEITVTYLDQENTLPGIPITRSTSVATAPDDLPIISVYPTHIEQVEDKSPEAEAKRLKLETTGKEDVKLMRDEIVAGARATLETPVRVSVQAPIIFSVQHKKLALHAKSISDIYAVAESELAAAKRDGREPVVTRIPLRLSRPTDVAIGKGFRVSHGESGFDPLEEGIFGGVIRLQIGSAGDEADTLIRNLREFSSGDLIGSSGNKDDLLSRGRVATIVVGGSDIVHLSVKDEQGQVLAKGDVELLSDAKLELMDPSYSVDNSAVHLGQRFFVRVTDPDHDVSDGQDVVNVAVRGPNGSADLKLTETIPHSGVFSAPLEPRLAVGVAVTSVTAVAGINVALGDELTFTYTDAKPLQSDSPVTHEITGRVYPGGDGNMAGFTKRFEDPDMAVKTRFLMAEALFEMAKDHRKLKQMDQATAEIAEGKRILEEAMRDYPDTKDVVQGEYLLANLAQEMENYTEAVGRYSNIIGSWPDSEYAIKAQLKKAICYERLKLPAQAAEEYVRLTYMYPESSYVADATVRLANQYYNTKNYETAGRIFKKFYDRHPEHELGSKSLFLAGQCSMKMEDYKEAVFRFQELIRAYPDDTTLRPEAMYWLGDAAFLGRDPAMAYKAFKQVTWDYPASKWAKIARGRLTAQTFRGMDEM